MKDADVRVILDTFGDIVTENKAVKIDDGAVGIPSADQVYDFVVQQITEVGKALNLILTILKLLNLALVTLSLRLMVLNGFMMVIKLMVKMVGVKSVLKMLM